MNICWNMIQGDFLYWQFAPILVNTGNSYIKIIALIICSWLQYLACSELGQHIFNVGSTKPQQYEYTLMGTVRTVRELIGVTWCLYLFPVQPLIHLSVNDQICIDYVYCCVFQFPVHSNFWLLLMFSFWSWIILFDAACLFVELCYGHWPWFLDFLKEGRPLAYCLSLPHVAGIKMCMYLRWYLTIVTELVRHALLTHSSLCNGKVKTVIEKPGKEKAAVPLCRPPQVWIFWFVKIL